MIVYTFFNRNLKKSYYTWIFRKTLYAVPLSIIESNIFESHFEVASCKPVLIL